MEAAFLLPVVLVLVLLVCQPAIILYDRAVMQGAASETCRLLATNVGGASRFDGNPAREYALRRLGAIPPLSLFHLHDEDCYDIEFSGAEGDSRVTVKITNRIRLLPLIGQAATFIGVAQDGVYTIEVSATAPATPAWASGSPDDWQSSWED